MDEKLSEGKVLEDLINAHLNHLKFRIDEGVDRADMLLRRERIQTMQYLTIYRELPDSKNSSEYARKLTELFSSDYKPG